MTVWPILMLVDNLVNNSVDKLVDKSVDNFFGSVVKRRIASFWSTSEIIEESRKNV